MKSKKHELECIGDRDASSCDDDLSVFDDSDDPDDIENREHDDSIDDSIDDLMEEVIDRAVMAFEMRRIHSTKLDAFREGVGIKKTELYKASDNVELSWQAYVTAYVCFMTELFLQHIETQKAIQEAESILTDYTPIHDAVGFERYVSAKLDKKISDAAIEASLGDSHSSSSSFPLPSVNKTVGFFTISDLKHTCSSDDILESGLDVSPHK